MALHWWSYLLLQYLDTPSFQSNRKVLKSNKKTDQFSRTFFTIFLFTVPFSILCYHFRV
jgi:hypothetical protein